MASADSIRHSFRQRLLAVLDYDGIPERQRVAHVAKAGKFSLSTARRMLTVDRDIGKSSGAWLLDLADGLSVNYRWLYNCTCQRFDPRTARIYLSRMEQWTHDEVEGAINSLLSGVDGEPDYLCYGYGLSLFDVMILEQRRRMTDWERNKQTRLCLRLINNDKKAKRLFDMSVRGQITRQQLFSMM